MIEKKKHLLSECFKFWHGTFHILNNNSIHFKDLKKIFAKNKAFQRRVDFTEARSFKPLLQSDNSCCHVCQVEH